MIANKYKIGEEIARGAFGCISKGLYVKKNEPVAIKIEYGDIQTLKHEVKILNFLSMSGVKKIPNIYWYGIFNENPCLIFTLFEYSLFDYMKKKEITIEKMNVLMRKAIDIIEHIHKKYVLHRDIKPQNFMIKDGDIFLIDFGLATFYIDENGQHYPNKKSDSIIGSPKFVSINVHNGHRYSRRDDMISLAYMYMYMILGDALWFTPLNRVSNNMNVDSLHIEHPINQMLRSNKHYDAFSQYTQSISCIDKYIQYTYALEYTDVPKYEPLALLFSLHT